jgi:hypothetical protein
MLPVVGGMFVLAGAAFGLGYRTWKWTGNAGVIDAAYTLATGLAPIYY